MIMKIVAATAAVAALTAAVVVDIPEVVVVVLGSAMGRNSATMLKSHSQMSSEDDVV